MRPAQPRSLRGATALAALLLAGLAPLAAWDAGAQQVVPQTDLAVREVLPGTPRVNATARLEAVVENLGPEEVVAFSVVFGFDNATQPLASNSTVSYPAQGANFVPSDESCALTPTDGLKPGCRVTVHFNWTVPLERRGPQNLSATAQVGPLNNDPVKENDELRVGAFVAHHQLALAIDPADNRPKDVEPGDAAFFRVLLHNLGNVDETARLAIASAQWGNASLASTRLTLGPGGRIGFLALLRAAADPDGEPRQTRANVTANSTVAPALGGVTLTLPEARSVDDAAGTHAFRAEPPTEAFVAAGGLTDVLLPVRNTGGAEDALRWELDGTLPQGWNASFPEPWLGLAGPAGALTHAALRVDADAALPSGASAVAALRGTSLNGQASETVNLTLRTAAADLALEALRLDRAAIYQQDEVLVEADVRNLGLVPMPKPARFAVDALRGDDDATRVVVGEVLFSGLGPGEARTLVARWRTGDLSGAFDLRARLDPDDAIPEVREDNNNRTVAVVVRLHGLALEAPPPREARPGAQLDYSEGATFVVRNLGNAPEEVLVRLASERGWLALEQRVRLGPAQAAAVPFTLQVPGEPGTLREALTATASLVNRSATSADAATAVTILDQEAPLLERLEAPQFVELGTAAEFRAVLRDAVGVANATLYLRLPDATVRTHAMELRSDGTWAVTVVLAQPGAVSFWLRAIDLAPQNNTLDTSGTQAALLVGVRSAPLVELLEPRNNTFIRSGTLLRLRITDVHGIGEVVVREGARTFLLESPYAIATAGLEEGPHTFEVIARNRFGNPTTERFAFTVDDTAPRVQDGRVEPAQPAPGQEFRVEARASQDTTLAVIQVSRDGALVREVPARAGLGLVTANLSLAEPGRYVLAVRVEDAAGNVASLELPVQVGGGIPGFGAMLALAGALGAASMARKRREP